MKSFNYLGQSFKPLRQFTKSEDKLGIRLPFHSTGISCYDDMHNSISSQWDYDEFYKLAEQAGAKEIDVFIMNGSIEVVPCSHELFKLIKK